MNRPYLNGTDNLFHESPVQILSALISAISGKKFLGVSSCIGVRPTADGISQKK
jgi:hypothetical protein